VCGETSFFPIPGIGLATDNHICTDVFSLFAPKRGEEKKSSSNSFIDIGTYTTSYHTFHSHPLSTALEGLYAGRFSFSFHTRYRCAVHEL